MHCFTIDQNTLSKMSWGYPWDDLQSIGLETSGHQTIRKELLFGGHATLQSDGEPLTGQKCLIVSQGSLRNKEASPESKKLFKNRIKAALMTTLKGLDESFSGKFELHFAEGVLQQVDITVN